MTINRIRPAPVTNAEEATAADTPSTINAANSNNSKTKLNNNKKERKYCLFYNRFGRCSKGTACPYVHDEKRIALCPRLNKGRKIRDNYYTDYYWQDFFPNQLINQPTNETNQFLFSFRLIDVGKTSERHLKGKNE
jgi:hypothetical protein